MNIALDINNHLIIFLYFHTLSFRFYLSVFLSCCHPRSCIGGRLRLINHKKSFSMLFVAGRMGLDGMVIICLRTPSVLINVSLFFTSPQRYHMLGAE